MANTKSPVSLHWNHASKKRKLSRPSSAFSEVAETNETHFRNQIIPFRRVLPGIEDKRMVCRRLKEEGNTLAACERYWEALSKFRRAIDYQEEDDGDLPEISILYELSSQCYSELGELYPAVRAAEQAVTLNKTCGVATRSLARAQVNIGELDLARVSIQRSLHMDPECEESWEDLKHIRDLREKLSTTEWTSLPIVTRPGIVCQRGDVSRGDVSRVDVSRDDVSTGDVSRGDVSRGDVSTDCT